MFIPFVILSSALAIFIVCALIDKIRVEIFETLNVRQGLEETEERVRKIMLHFANVSANSLNLYTTNEKGEKG